jgi:hypothetical protein
LYFCVQKGIPPVSRDKRGIDVTVASSGVPQ